MQSNTEGIQQQEKNEEKEDSCEFEYNSEDERRSDVFFYRTVNNGFEEDFEVSEKYNIFDEMINSWWGGDGIFKDYWNKFRGDDDFRDLSDNKPWEKGNEMKYFNYGFSEESWRGYRKKHAILKNYKNEILGLTREDEENQFEKRRKRRSYENKKPQHPY